MTWEPTDEDIENAWAAWDSNNGRDEQSDTALESAIVAAAGPRIEALEADVARLRDGYAELTAAAHDMLTAMHSAPGHALGAELKRCYNRIRAALHDQAGKSGAP